MTDISATSYFRQQAGGGNPETAGPNFEHEEEDTGGTKWPTRVTLRAVHPETGDPMGFLRYRVPKRKADKIAIDRLETHTDHVRKGVGSALMDEMQRRHPSTPIDHGDRTPDGKAWWKGYTQDKSVSRGRTLASVTDIFRQRTATTHPGPAPETFAKQDGEDHYDHEDRVRHGLSMGHLTYDQAREHKYSGSGRENTAHDGWGPTPTTPKGWQPLPHELYHTTTDAAGVATNGLKTGKDLGQENGHGLGGTPQWLSMTHSAEHAHNMLHALHEYHDHLNGKTSFQNLHHAAQNGEGAQQPFHKAFTSAFGGENEYAQDSRARGKRLEPGFSDYKEAKEKGWTPHPQIHRSFDGKDGKKFGTGWERDTNVEDRHDEYGAFSRARQFEGKGRDSILFLSNDRKAFAQKDPSNFAVLKLKPKPNAHGFPMKGEHEWRTGTGDAVQVHGEPLRRTSARIGNDDPACAYRHSGACPDWRDPARTSAQLPSGFTHETRPNALGGHTLHGYINGEHAGYLEHDRYGQDTGVSVHNLHTNPAHRGSGVASAMMDALHQQYPKAWINHGTRTDDGAGWWNRYKDPAPHRNIHNVAADDHSHGMPAHWTQHWNASEVKNDTEYNDAVSSKLGLAGKQPTSQSPPSSGDNRLRGTIQLRPQQQPPHPPAAPLGDDRPRGTIQLRTSARVQDGDDIPSGYLNPHGHHIKVKVGGQTNVELVPRHEVEQYASQETTKEHTKEVGEHIIDTGEMEPLILHYHPKSGEAYLGEGNHRLRAARTLQMDHVPLRVTRNNYGLPAPGVKTPQDHPAIAAGTHVPYDIRPSDIGLGTGQHKTASSDTPVPDNTQPYEHHHDWLPRDHFFAPGKQGLDPRLFDGERMHPEIRQHLLSLLNSFWAPKYGDTWQSWARVYLAGSEASHFYGNDDLDVLIGINYDVARHHVDAFTGEPDGALDTKLTDELRSGLNDDHRMLPGPDGEVGPFESTFYVNPGSYDIRAIKPYAAYDITRDEWAVRPVEVPDDFGPEKLPESTWDVFDALTALIKAISELPAGVREREGAALYDYLHADRHSAFGPDGTGLYDPANATWKALDKAPGAPLQQLIDWKHAHDGVAATDQENAA